MGILNFLQRFRDGIFFNSYVEFSRDFNLFVKNFICGVKPLVGKDFKLFISSSFDKVNLSADAKGEMIIPLHFNVIRFAGVNGYKIHVLCCDHS